MRRWLRAAGSAADVVSAEPALWLPGALAWCLTLGWAPLLLAVAAPPNVADLTFFGAGIYTSGAWPWNAILLGAGAVLVAVAVVVLTALSEVLLATRARRPPAVGDVGRVAALGSVTAVPAAAAILLGGVAFVLVAMDEFTSPGAGDPLLRTLGRLAPFGMAIVLAWLVGATVHAAATRAVVLGGEGVVTALRRAPGRVLRGSGPALVCAVATTGAKALFLVVATLLLGVLWASIATRLAVGGIDPALVPLLVGFVAIWLCLVIAGGVLQAWASVAWTIVLDPGAANPRRGPQPPS